MSLALTDVALLQYGPAITLQVRPGEMVCIVGPAGSGKSRLCRIIEGDTPDRGHIERPERVVSPKPCNRKLRPQDLSHKRGLNQAAIATDALTQLGLWDARQTEISALPPGQVAACELVEPLLSNADLVVLDGHLDSLDPWARAGALRLVRHRCSHGAIFVVATNHLDLVDEIDYLVVLKEGQPLHVGSVRELVAERGQRMLAITSERNPGVRALLDPLQVDVTRTEDGYKITPGPGQNHTAKLLREGYGDVKFLVCEPLALAQIVRDLIG